MASPVVSIDSRIRGAFQHASDILTHSNTYDVPDNDLKLATDTMHAIKQVLKLKDSVEMVAVKHGAKLTFGLSNTVNNLSKTVRYAQYLVGYSFISDDVTEEELDQAKKTMEFAKIIVNNAYNLQEANHYTVKIVENPNGIADVLKSRSVAAQQCAQQ